MGGRNGIQIVKKELKLPLFTDDMIICVENPVESAKKNVIRTVSEFSKVLSYK